MAPERPASQSSLPRPDYGRSRVQPHVAPGSSVLQKVSNTDYEKMPPPPKPGVLRHIKSGSFVPITSGDAGSSRKIPKGERSSLTQSTARNNISYPVLGRASGSSNIAGARPASSLGISRPQSLPMHNRSSSAQGMGGDVDEAENLDTNRSAPAGGTGCLPGRGAQRGHTGDLPFNQLMDLFQIHKAELDQKRLELESLQRKEIQWETSRVTLETQVTRVQFELETLRRKTADLERAVEDEKRDRRAEREDSSRRSREDMDELRRRHRDEIETLKRNHQEAMDVFERKFRHEIMDEKAARTREVQDVKAQAALERQRLEMQMDGDGREVKGLKMELEARNSELQRERQVSNQLRDKILEQNTESISMESARRALNAKIEDLENARLSQLNEFSDLTEQLKLANERALQVSEKLRNEELIRRKLHNQVQELKGNIRVYCRVRPTLEHEKEGAAEIKFPDRNFESKEIEIVGAPEKSALGNISTKTYPFSFDKVFGPGQRNSDIFEELSQLVQSALDGYNVCIFCYGQTGSGKTYTMSASDGMIPKAVHQIYDTAKGLEEKGWQYVMEGSFVEVYNENINDLLGKADDIDKKKHEIRHDLKELKTTITDVETLVLDTPSCVENILKRAAQTRAVAATKANERSSRSHSVFILRLKGVSAATGQRCEGTLNLVDLAGSERLAHSQSTGERLRETQSINRSLSCLGDVIAALGNGKEGSHIPYRNSKLTYLLQYSLGGNSKCLMFVMVSPMKAHLGESLTSLKFATKVNNTSIGTAKRVLKPNA